MAPSAAAQSAHCRRSAVLTRSSAECGLSDVRAARGPVFDARGPARDCGSEGRGLGGANEDLRTRALLFSHITFPSSSTVRVACLSSEVQIESGGGLV